MTGLVMLMPYKALVQKAREEGLRIHAIWDLEIARGFFGAGAEAYLRGVEESADRFQLTDFADTAGLERVVRAAVDEFDADYLYHVGSEDTMLWTYRLAEELGRAVNPAHAIEQLNDKLMMRRLLDEHGVSAVRYATAGTWRDVSGVLDGFELPVVVKPTELSGSRGVMLLDNRADLAGWGALLDSYGYAGPMLVEEYLRGEEFSVETLSDNGHHHVVGVTAKLLGPAPRFVEAGHVHPAPATDPRVARMGELAVELLTLAGYRSGPAHTEIIWTADGPRIVESQARLGGDKIPKLIELASGFDIERAVFQIIAGTLCEPPEPTVVGHISYFDLPRGMVRHIDGLDDIRALPYVADLQVPFAVGDVVPETVDSKTRHGFVILDGASADQVFERVRHVRSLLRVTVDAEVTV